MCVQFTLSIKSSIEWQTIGKGDILCKKCVFESMKSQYIHRAITIIYALYSKLVKARLVYDVENNVCGTKCENKTLYVDLLSGPYKVSCIELWNLRIQFRSLVRTLFICCRRCSDSCKRNFFFFIVSTQNRIFCALHIYTAIRFSVRNYLCA